MKKIVVGVVIGLCVLIGSSVASADSEVGGIYVINGDFNQLVSVHKTGDKIVAVGLNNYVSLFDVLVGSERDGFMDTL